MRRPKCNMPTFCESAICARLISQQRKKENSGDRGQPPEEERDERAAEVAPSGRLGEYPHADRPCARKDDEKRWHGAKKARPMSAPPTIAAPKTMTEALKRRAVRPTPRSLMALFAML